jgi:hypothetical protein
VDERGKVYFIRDKCTQYVKIGFTRGDPTSRMKDLQCASPGELELLSYYIGERDLERALHRVFAHARVRGEWFEPLPIVMEYAGFRHQSPYEGAGLWRDIREMIESARGVPHWTSEP